MLDSKVDKQIKRYLKSISDKKVVISKINNSCHYYIITEQGEFHIRFSDHFSTSGKICDFDIVKVRDLYIIRFNSIQYSLYTEDALIYIKALLLVGPEMSKQLEQSRNETISALNSLNYYKCKWNKHQEDIKFMNDIWEEKEKIEKENKLLLKYKNTYNDLLYKYNKIKHDLKISKNNFNTIQNNYNKLKNQFTNLNNKLQNLKQIFNKIKDDKL